LSVGNPEWNRVHRLLVVHEAGIEAMDPLERPKYRVWDRIHEQAVGPDYARKSVKAGVKIENVVEDHVRDADVETPMDMCCEVFRTDVSKPRVREP